MKQTDIASRAGIRQSTLSNILAGRRRPSWRWRW
ncbi:helix-turn-helix domain-containing protein, partial [Patescibacteria group bacterium]|nr:helix-turn-helix domain-containing protein [Patescibacteria group bacterium]